jgi:hypothetical protein
MTDARPAPGNNRGLCHVAAPGGQVMRIGHWMGVMLLGVMATAAAAPRPVGSTGKRARCSLLSASPTARRSC